MFRGSLSWGFEAAFHTSRILSGDLDASSSAAPALEPVYTDHPRSKPLLRFAVVEVVEVAEVAATIVGYFAATIVDSPAYGNSNTRRARSLRPLIR